MDFSKFRDTGELSDLTVSVGGKDFLLHKFPLFVKSDFFRALARGDKEKVAISDFPGGADTFEQVANYCYNIKVDINPDNVCGLRCAAEFLQMNTMGNLADVTDRYLQDTLTSAKLARSLGTVSGLLNKCLNLGAIADQCNIVDRCLNAIVDCWLISPKFSKRIVASEKPDGDAMFQLTKLPLHWYKQLVALAKEKSVRPNVLTRLVQNYIDNVFDAMVEVEQVQPEEESPAPEVKEQKKVEDASPGGPPEATPADADQPTDARPESPKPEQQQQALTPPAPVQTRPKSPVELVDLPDIAEVLDALVLELPDNPVVSENLPPQWVIRVLVIADEKQCQCRGRLLELAARILDRMKPADLSELSPDLMADLIRESAKDTNIPQEDRDEEICMVVDTYLSEMASKDGLTVEVFTKMVDAVPRDHRSSHDTIFRTMEKLLKSDQVQMSEEERERLLSVVDFSRLSESALRDAYETDLVPVSYVAKAAISLCQSLRNELDTANRTISHQEELLHKYGLTATGAPIIKRGGDLGSKRSYMGSNQNLDADWDGTGSYMQRDGYEHYYDIERDSSYNLPASDRLGRYGSSYSTSYSGNRLYSYR